MPPLVSIGLPVRDGENLLRRAVDSLLRRDYDNLEFVISDYPSTDCTAAFCMEYIIRDSRVRYFPYMVREAYMQQMIIRSSRLTIAQELALSCWSLCHYLFVNMIVGGARSLVPRYLKDLRKRIVGRGKTKPLHRSQ